MQWMMLQQDSPDDFVIASGEQRSVREFVILSARKLGIELNFEGDGVDEVGIVSSVSGDSAEMINEGQVIVRVNPRYFRPTEVEELLGDPSKAIEKLGWKTKISFEQLCEEMVLHDLKQAKKNRLLISHGHEVDISKEN